MGDLLPNEPCDGFDRNCVWRVARQLTAAGRRARPIDLCIALTYAGSPCGKKAVRRIGENFDEDGEERHLGQPFCAIHLNQILGYTFQLHDATQAQELRRLVELEHQEQQKQVEDKKKQKRQTQPVFLYYAQCGDRLKIGISESPNRRLRNLETGMGRVFDRVWLCKGSRAKEARLHRQFAAHRLVGEWFVAADSEIVHLDIGCRPGG